MKQKMVEEETSECRAMSGSQLRIHAEEWWGLNRGWVMPTTKPSHGSIKLCSDIYIHTVLPRIERHAIISEFYQNPLQLQLVPITACRYRVRCRYRARYVVTVIRGLSFDINIAVMEKTSVKLTH